MYYDRAQYSKSIVVEKGQVWWDTARCPGIVVMIYVQ